MKTTDLEREDIIAMLKGLPMSYERMSPLQGKKAGTFQDNRGWRWDDHFIARMGVDEILALYFELKAIDR